MDKPIVRQVDAPIPPLLSLADDADSDADADDEPIKGKILLRILNDEYGSDVKSGCGEEYLVVQPLKTQNTTI